MISASKEWNKTSSKSSMLTSFSLSREQNNDESTFSKDLHSTQDLLNIPIYVIKMAKIYTLFHSKRAKTPRLYSVLKAVPQYRHVTLALARFLTSMHLQRRSMFDSTQSKQRYNSQSLLSCLRF